MGSALTQRSTSATVEQLKLADVEQMDAVAKCLGEVDGKWSELRELLLWVVSELIYNPN